MCVCRQYVITTICFYFYLLSKALEEIKSEWAVSREKLVLDYKRKRKEVCTILYHNDIVYVLDILYCMYVQ